MEELLSKSFIKDLKLDGTYNEDSFSREYESCWGGDAENSFFSQERFDKQRVLLQPEYEFSKRTSKDGYYILGVDVGRFKCTTEIVVIKVTPQGQGASIKSVVNGFTYDAEHFEEQAIAIKRLFFKYKARCIAIDGGGVGAGLVDYMVKSQVDPATGETLPDFGVYNDDDGSYKKFRTPITIPNALYIIKANGTINSEMYSYVQTQILNNKIKFLIDERTAKVKLMQTKVGQNMTPDQRADYLKPFVFTTVLKEQMMNLIVEDTRTANIVLKQATRVIKKDKFSAICYGMYYVKQQDGLREKRRSRDMSKFAFFSSGAAYRRY